MSRRFLFLSFLFLAGVLQSVGAADSSEQFLSAYQAYQQGEKAERDGSTGEALKNYRYAESLLQSISSKDPSWQKAVVEYRLKKTREGLSRLQGSADASTSAVSVPGPSDPGAPSESQAGPSITITPPSASGRQQAPVASTSEVRRLKKLVDSLKSELQSVKDAASAEKSRSDDLDKMQWTKEKSRLEQQLGEARDQVAALGEKLRKRDSWEKDLKDLQKRLDDALADKTTAEEYYQQREKKLVDTSAELSRQLEEARGKIAAGSESGAKVGELTKQIEQDRESLKQLQAKLDHAVDAAKEGEARNADLNSRIKDLSAKLADSQKQVDEMSPLREKVVLLQQEVQGLRKETDSSKTTIAGMTKTAGQREADFSVLSEERAKLASEVQRLGEAVKEASKVKGLEEKASELNNTVSSLKQQLDASTKEAARAKELLARSEEDSKVAKQKILNVTAAAAADRAVIEEERKKLEAGLDEATKKIAGLATQAQTLETLKKETSDLRSQVDQRTKALQEADAKIVRIQKDASEQKDDQARKFAAAETLKKLLENQNATLQQQLKEALGQMGTLIDKRPETAAMQDQLSKLQQQLDTSVKNYAESQKKLAEMATSRPEQEKLLNQREKELAEARAEAKKLQGDLESSNRKITELQQQSREGGDRLKQLQDQLAELSTKTSSADKATEALQKEVDRLKAEASSTKDKLASQKEESRKNKELQQQLEDKEAELARLKRRRGSKGALADAKTADENGILRTIILRQVKEEAKRSQARRLMEEEMKRLNLQSQTLSEQIGVLAAPALVLSQEERALFKEGQLVVVDDGVGALQASVAAPMPSQSLPAQAAQTGTTTGTNGTSDTSNPAGVPDASAQSTNKAKSPEEPPKEMEWQGKFKECLARAKDEFDRQDYLQAESSFKEALGYSPDDYFALSNLGVVEFQLGKLKEAEEALSKASKKKSDSSFALTTLGIVNYRQERLDEAEKTLRKAIVVNDQDFTAHNYLGIVLAASGKGKAGESEIMKSIEINKNYADAHFNLAVIYATGKPPSKMMAKKHYAKALELGAPPDPSLERLVQ